MLKIIKKAFTILICIYLLLCVITPFTYETMIRIIGKDEIVYRSFDGKNFMVYLEEGTVNFVTIENVTIDYLRLATIPIVADKISYNLEDPEQSRRSFKFDGKKYFLYDENNLLPKGMVIKCIQLTDYYGAPESSLVYFGVSKEKPEVKEGLIDIKKYDSLNESYYLFMFESEEEIKFDELCNACL